MIIKLWALDGVSAYSKDPFNVFDAILVVISLADLLLVFVEIDINLRTIKVFRSLRLLRMFKLAKRSENLLTLFQAIKETLKDVAYFMLLLVICIFIFALVGMEWFAYTVRLHNINDSIGIPPHLSCPTCPQPGVSPRLNFDDIINSLMTVTCIIINEDWNIVLYTFVYNQTSIAGKYYAYSYILFVVLIGNFLLLQTFLALLIGNF
jgi:hypothetical protein